MSTPYTPVATYHGQINVTVDGDLANAGEFNTPYEQCADNAAFCKAVIDPLITGGTISPSGFITLDTKLTVPSFHCTGDATVDGPIFNNAGEILTGQVICSGDVGADTVTAEGDIQTVTGSLATAGASIGPTGDFSGRNVTASGNVAVSGTAALTDATVSGAMSVAGSIIAALNFSVTGRPRVRSVRGVDSAAVTYAAYFNIISFPNMASVDRIGANAAVIDAGGGQGDWMILCIDPTAHQLQVDFPGGATVTFPVATLVPQAALFAFIGSAWIGPLFQV